MILDTNAVSALLAGDSGLEVVLAGTDRHHVPAIVVGEYRYGLIRSRNRSRLEPLMERMLDASILLVVDRSTGESYAKVRAALREKGTPIPENDVWIAALSKQHDLPVVSRDGHFDHVDGLVRIDW